MECLARHEQADADERADERDDVREEQQRERRRRDQRDPSKTPMRMRRTEAIIENPRPFVLPAAAG